MPASRKADWLRTTMLDIMHKKIIAIVTTDAQFLPGETLEESFARTDLAYGDGLKIYFANQTDTTNEGDRGPVLEIGVVVPLGENPLISMRLGDWEIRDDEMHVVG
jgi:hypothetical protein